jgi:hypothetical protein
LDKLGNRELITELTGSLPSSEVLEGTTPEDDAVLNPRLPGLTGFILMVKDSTFSALALYDLISSYFGREKSNSLICSDTCTVGTVNVIECKFDWIS